MGDDARRWRLGLLGHPLGHSVSPPMHEAALRALGLEGSYALFDVAAGGLAERVGALRAGALDGLNVTVPYKEAVAALCDRTEGDARALGAVNTLVRGADGAVVGHNTDLPGLVDAVAARWPGRPWAGRAACVLGAGGAGRAAVLAACALGAAEVRVWNRTEARAEALVEALAGAASARLAVSGAAAEAAAGAALVLQATSAGMGTTPGHAEWAAVRARAAAALEGVAEDAVLVDLVYRPEETPFVAAARARGLEADHGLEMLVRQAARAFTLWTGYVAPVAVMRAAGKAALAAH